MASSALIVFAKTPVAGEVKTRLHPQLNYQEAAEFYTACLLESYKQFSRLTQTDIIYYHPPHPQESYLRTLLKQQVHWEYQVGIDLGSRMHHAFSQVLTRYKKAVVIGTDHPDLPITYIKKAFDVLDYVDVSIGPSKDGGYYCLGLKHAYPFLFENMTWSNENVFTTTIDRIHKHALDSFQCPEWYDIDSFDDLIYFKTHTNLKQFPILNEFFNRSHFEN